MFWIQVLIIALIFVVFSGLLFLLFKKFKQERFVGFLTIPLLIYSIGFCLRLAGKQYLIDLGFFLTDISALFFTALFVSFLFLGQLKYWGINSEGQSVNLKRKQRKPREDRG